MEKVERLTVTHRTRTRLQSLPPVISEYAFWLSETKKPQTVLEYIKDIGLFVDYLEEKRKETGDSSIVFEELSSQDVEDFLFSFLSEHEKVYQRLNGKEVHQRFKNSEKSQRRKLSSIRSFSRFLFIEKKLIKTDITYGIEIGKTPDKELPFLSKSLQSALLDSMEVHSEDEFQKVRNQFMALLFIKNGIKTGELLALNLKDISMENRQVRILREDEDPIYLSLQSIPDVIIRRYLELRGERKILMGWHHDALFVSMRNKRLNRRTIHYIFQRYEGFLHLKTPLTPQLLRNTFVKESVSKGGVEDELSKQLGIHDKYSMRRTYPVLKEMRK
ncbi:MULTISPECIES: tyrosine-type recombinase/integrase [unclassified Exiguobacterium]|uniref:tyrosine-type recombinase/integrase n=1 Tax=unclassified Exiguobacterium TaxID=2644629 RepID=UPI001BE91887|nr:MULTISPECIES: tyrosine-type recombinase/integrase [unclassified Exiguobacterium]